MSVCFLIARLSCSEKNLKDKYEALKADEECLTIRQ